MADQDFDPLLEKTPTGPAVSSNRVVAPAPAITTSAPVIGVNTSQFADSDDIQASAARRLNNAPVTRRSEHPPNAVHHQSYDSFRKEYIVQSIIGLFAVLIVMTSIVIFGVFVSGTLILIFSFLFLPFICGIGIFLSLRRPGALIISIGILIALSAGILASFAFVVYHDVQSMPLYTHVNASIPATEGQYLDRKSILLFDKPVSINKTLQGKHCDNDQWCTCVAAIQSGLTVAQQPNLTYWAACPLLSDENCMDLTSCLGEWDIRFNAGITLEKNTPNRQDYWLAVQNAVNASNGTLNPQPGAYVILYWEENPRVLGGTLLATGWLLLSTGLFGYIGLVLGCWFGCYDRIRRSAASDSERQPLFAGILPDSMTTGRSRSYQAAPTIAVPSSSSSSSTSVTKSTA